MESYGLEMDDLFDDRDISQELNDFETAEEHTIGNEAGEQPDDSNNTHNEEEGNISQQVAEKLRQLGKGAAKKRVLRPQPKLDSARLTGERGIPILPKLFEDVKYNGKGHEARDLDKLMGVMEHWAHRLFPKMPFDEVIKRVERLGAKKAVQTCINKMRLDMPLLDNDFVSQVSDEENGDAGRHHVEEEISQPDELNAEDEIQPDHTILDEDEEALNDLLEQERHESSQDVLTASTPYPKGKVTAASTAQSTSTLSEEQLERIRQNQEKARQRRLNKSAAPDESLDSLVLSGPNDSSVVYSLSSSLRPHSAANNSVEYMDTSIELPIESNKELNNSNNDVIVGNDHENVGSLVS